MRTVGLDGLFLGLGNASAERTGGVEHLSNLGGGHIAHRDHHPKATEQDIEL